MTLPADARNRFDALVEPLFIFVNNRRKVLARTLRNPKDLRATPPDERIKIHDMLFENPSLFDEYCKENPNGLGEADLAAIRRMKSFVRGGFLVLKERKNDAIFINYFSKDQAAYIVTPTLRPWGQLLPFFPALLDTRLLPFESWIVCDGMLSIQNILLGPGMIRSAKKAYSEHNKAGRVITELAPISPSEETPSEESPIKVTKKGKKAPAAKKSPSSPKDDKSKDAVKRKLSEIETLIESFCETHLNKEYAALCKELAQTISRKRPSPLASGQARTWAAGIVRAIGMVNFLHDKKTRPYLPVNTISEGFSVSVNTSQAKSLEIRKLLNINYFDPRWTLPSKVEDNPLAWQISINGFILDARHAPRHIQEAAFANGLIPYIPDDRKR
jgi:hypothetical protein